MPICKSDPEAKYQQQLIDAGAHASKLAFEPWVQHGGRAGVRPRRLDGEPLQHMNLQLHLAMLGSKECTAGRALAEFLMLMSLELFTHRDKYKPIRLFTGPIGLPVH